MPLCFSISLNNSEKGKLNCQNLSAKLSRAVSIILSTALHK
jgi:hypothetical protein